jgi:tRNA threonylcarbamoyladenosine biosynthesis protein TsaE
MDRRGRRIIPSVTHSAEETIALGMEIGSQLAPGSILCFFGDLGAGKTTFIKGLVAGATDVAPEDVNSPTFVYLNIYEGAKTVYHFDLYRLRSADEFFAMGFDEYFYMDGICCIEWSERISEALPENVVCVNIEQHGMDSRKITISSLGEQQ